MRNKRRRIFYIDRVFQKKLMVLFLAVNLLVVMANILFYFVHLKGALEENLYRSHISLSNVSEVIAGDVLKFNLLLAVGCLALVLLFYTFTRLKLKRFFDNIKGVLTLGLRDRRKLDAVKIGEEFQDIHRVMEHFTQQADKQLETQEQRVQSLSEKIG